MPATTITLEAARAALTPPRPGEPFDEASERIRELAVDFLAALGDAEYERREGEDGLTLATFERLCRAHAEIGPTLEEIRVELALPTSPQR
jgi:hypothetical protein